MISTGKLYKVVAVLVSLGLLLQIFVVPASWFSGGVGTAEAVGDEFAVPPSELTNELFQASQVDAGSWLRDAGANRQEGISPDSLANPISIARVQSAYVPGDAVTNTLVISFTVTNNQLPLQAPEVPDGATVTETVDILNAFDYTADPNTLHNVVISDVLTSDATYLTASPAPDSTGSQLLFNLGDIPPSGSVTATLKVKVPGVVADFTPLDVGAIVFAELQGRAISASTIPAVLAPDSFGQYLQGTLDADIFDAEMLKQAAELGMDPTALFEFVRAFGYESYEGSLRGTRGTLWSQAGNSVDQASLLIAMLRAGGTPARYVRGTLNTTLSQQLILSMFPEPTRIIGHIEPGTETADPANDPDLLAETQDHWWVQAYIGGSWVDIDPTFTNAEPGDTFATVDETWDEIPDSLRHKITLKVKVEKMEPFDVTSNDFSITYPLTATFNSVRLAGKPVMFSHFVQSSGQGGLAFVSYEHNYTPYFAIGEFEDLIQGETYQDLLTNFPFGSTFATGVWLIVESTAPGGETESHERILKDLLGAAARQPTGMVSGSIDRGDSSQPLFTELESMVLQVVPYSHIPIQRVSQKAARINQLAPQVVNAYEALLTVDPDDQTDFVEFTDEHLPAFLLAQLNGLDTTGLLFQARSTAPARNYDTESLLVKSYPSRPKLILMSQTSISTTVSTTFELLNIDERSLAYPGQALDAVYAANMIRTIGDKIIEYQLLEELYGSTPDSALSTFLTAIDNDIDSALVTFENLIVLDSLEITDEAKARITTAVLNGASVFVPQEMVQIDGEPTIGWLEVDESGHASFISEDGRRMAASAEQLNLITAIIGLVAAGVGFLTALIGFGTALLGLLTALIGLFVLAAGAASGFTHGSQALVEPVDPVKMNKVLQAVAEAEYKALAECDAQDGTPCQQVNSLAKTINIAGNVATPQSPLPASWISSDPAQEPVSVFVNSTNYPSTVAGTTLNVNATVGMAAITSLSDVDWTSSAAHAFTFDDLSTTNASLYDSDGTLLDTGTATATSPLPAVVTGSSVMADISGIGSAGFYASAAAGLGSGNEWMSYTADITAAQPHTVTLEKATVMVDGNTYTGSLYLVVNGTTTLDGSGPAGAGNFATTIDLQTLNGGGLMLGPAGGTFEVNGQPVDVSNGIAVGNYTGSVTVSEAAGDTDQIAFNGTADFFTLALSQTTSTTNPNSMVVFDTIVEANFSDVYTVTVDAPDGWTTSVDANGQVTAIPPRGAAPDDYAILITIQSEDYPALFASAVHTVTITAVEAMQMSVSEDGAITVPMGEILNGDDSDYLGRGIEPFGQANDGRPEIPGAAYTVVVTNTSTMSHAFDINVTGLPAGWLVLSGAEGQTNTTITLGAGERGEVGIYIVPTGSTLPSSGSSYPFDVTITAVDNPALTDTDNLNFSMPAVPFPYLELEVPTRYVTAGTSADFELTVTNTGNSNSAGFPVTLTIQSNVYAPFGSVTGTLPATPSDYDTPALTIGSSNQQAISVDTTGAETGESYLLAAHSSGQGYIPVTYGLIQIVGPNSGPIFEAADETAEACQIGEPGLSAALRNLGLSVSELEASCDTGSCSLDVRDEVVEALDNVVFYSNVSPLVTADTTLATIAGDLTGHTTNVDIEADMAAISAAVSQLETEICELSQHNPAINWQPAYNAGLVGQPVSYTLDVTNQGTVTTTYAVTVELPSGTTTFNTSLAPGETASTEYAVSGGALGLYDLTATARADSSDVFLAGLTDETEATLNVVDKFIQLTAVTADPDFVETGASSTDISIDVSNIANIPWDATAETQILAPNGGISYTADIPVTILIGDPRTYDLASVNTSGWAEGVYTITVDLVNGSGDPITDGSGYGYFGVGQAIGVSQSVAPELVAPGTVTVTTVITTEVLQATIISPSVQSIQPIEPRVWQVIGETAEEETAGSETTTQPEGVEETAGSESNILTPIRPDIGEDDEVAISASLILTTTGITRTEQDEPSIVYTGTWQAITAQKASSSGMVRADDPGDSVAFTFTGMEVSLGFIGGSNGAIIEVFIDGASQGLVDLYRREDTPLRFTYYNFITGTHTISFTHSGTTNPYATNDFVQFDYIDVRDGVFPADGTFEQDSSRVFSSNTWSTLNNATASGGSYYRDQNATVWFPFSGDSVTYQYLPYNNGGVADIYIDNQWVTRVDQYNISIITETISFDGLGPGFHMMMVTTYRGNVTVDAFSTPGTGPFYTPITPTGFTRFEDDNPALLYNGQPFTITNPSWTRQSPIYSGAASEGQHIYSNTADDTVSLTFDGVWASVGFYTEDNAGMAELFVDGVSQGIVDTYSNEDDVTSFTVDGLIAGTHTISVTVLGTANPLASNTRVNIDYIDVWDGTALPSGLVEQDDPGVYRSAGLIDGVNASASGGTYVEETNFANSTIWYPFEGDSITYQALDFNGSEKTAVYIDEVFQGYYDLYTNQAPTITFSFDGLGLGLHMIKLRHYRDDITLDAFITPAIEPAPPPPTPTTFTRYEEDYPAIRYNGQPYTATAASWNRNNNVALASDGQHINSSVVGNSISIDFSGTWVALGFFTDRFGGQVEVFIDGASQGILDLYTRDDDVASYVYEGLADANHTISMTLLSTSHPNSSGTSLKFDYYETWDGNSTPAATYEEVDDEVRLGDYHQYWDYIVEPAASGGMFINDGFQRDSAAWFPFTGDSVTFLGLANNAGDRVRISIDGVQLGTFNLYSNTPVTRAYSFDGLGAGPHMMQVRSNRSELNLDAFMAPGIAPFYQTPVYTGVVRYEEDNPALVYNNQYDFTYRPQGWNLHTTAGQVSGRWNVNSNDIGHSVSLTFDGRWAAVGFRTRNQVSVAEVFIDGVSQGTFDLDNDGFEDVTVIPFGGLVTGTHTISVSVAAGTVYFDYFDVWDGQPMSDDIVDLRRSEDNGRIHYSASLIDIDNDNAIEDAFLGTTLLNTNSNLWYTFIGDSFTFYGFSRSNTTYVDLYVDGVFIETIDVEYPYSPQPLAFQYSGFGDGPHIVRIHNGITLRADAFQSNPATPAPYSPIVEWYDTAGYGSTGSFGTPAGMLMGIAAGDVTGDGLVEIVAPSDTFTTGGNFINSIFIYRGDGEDTGDGDPLIHRIDFPSTGTGLGRETIGSVALADLDGLPGAEILVGSEVGMYAFRGDGSTLWFTDTYQSLILNATPAVGNLDFDDAPEIVVNMDTDLVIYEANGDISWANAYTSTLGTPVLADLTNDGRLDIIVYDSSGKVYAYDYNFGSPTLLWQTQLSSPVVTVRGGPAVVDLDGNGTPEIAMTHDGAHTVLDRDGNVFWSIPLDPGAAGGVSVADIDGDFEPEIVTGIKYDDGVGVGRLYALNADGSILWQVPAYDSTSANSQSVLDINGDGVYEIAWNGAELGFTIFNGIDGSILFNEPLADSLTGTDYPIFVDVDHDGFAEVVAPTNDGIVVFGQDYVWGESRPIWNQHTYHITNINDDMSVPFSEANSWDVHNTYRTQWPEAIVLPVYDVTLTHTVGITGVSVVSSTFSVSPTVSADPTYGWDYTQSWANVYITRTFESVLADIQPGETRLVAQGTEVAYELPSGTNYLALPPLYVSAPHIIHVEPLSLTVGTGGTAVYDVVLDNPAAASDTYSLTVAGLPDSWLTFPAAVPVSAGSQVTVPLTVQVPAGASLGSMVFNVFAANSSGGQDLAGSELVVIDGLDVSVEPNSQSAPAGTAVTYTLVLSNYFETAQTYTLTAEGAADVTLPPTVTVPAATSFLEAPGTTSLPFTVSSAENGSYPFTIHAESGSAADSDSAVLETTGDLAVGISLVPASAVGGPLTPAVFTVTVSNLGELPDSYDLDVTMPAGWSYQFLTNGSEINSVSLTPHIFNSADVLLLVTPAVGATPGSYDIDVSAQSQANVGVSAAVSGTVDVQNRGVVISITPQSSTMLPTDAGNWQVAITNTGSVADSYWLTMTGFIGPFGDFSTNPVALNAGQSTTVQLTADNMDVMLPGTYQFSVVAESQNNALIKNQAIADVTFESFEDVSVGWRPVSQTITDTLTADFIMVVTNTGNVNTTYDLGLNLPGGLAGQLATNQLLLPAHLAAAFLVTVQADGPGTYQFDGTADSTSSGASDSSSATLEVIFTNLPPSADAGGDETADEGETINFNGTASDPEGQPLDILWDFGDGNTAGGTLTPTHAYDDDGQYTVTLIVTDTTGLSSSDTLEVTVNNVAPTVDAGLNQNAFEGDTVSLDPATFSDPGVDDTHTATIDWGDGTVEPGTINQTNDTVDGSHVYEDNGSFTVTVTVTDDDSGQGSDSFTVTVANVAPQVDAGNDQTVDEGDTVSLDPATFIDTGGDDTHTATIDWGDGTVEPGTVNQGAGTVSGSHVYEDNGNYTVTVTVTDDDGGSDSDSFTVTVNNVAPSVEAGSDQNINVGDTVSLDPATFSDPGTADTHTATIDWDDGTVEPGTVNQGAGTVNGSHVYTQAGTYMVTITVTDDDGGVSSDTFTVVVTGPDMYYNYIPVVHKP